jgi:hypothetical protein
MDLEHLKSFISTMVAITLNREAKTGDEGMAKAPPADVIYRRGRASTKLTLVKKSERCTGPGVHIIPHRPSRRTILTISITPLTTLHHDILFRC